MIEEFFGRARTIAPQEGNEPIMADMLQTPPIIRDFGRVNWLGLWTLYTKEVKRFMRVAPQTILAPIISNLL